MGNLCSSGTERTDKKEDNRAPDKPREGEDEALLPACGAELGVAPEGVQVSAEGEDGKGSGGGHGFGGFLSEAAKSGGSAFTEVTRSAKEEGEQAAATALQSGREATDKVVEDVQSSATAAVTETVAGATAVAEESVTGGVETVKEKATAAYQSAAERLQETTGKLTSNVTNVVGGVKNEAEARGSEADAGAESLGSEVSTLQSKTVSDSAEFMPDTETTAEKASPLAAAQGGIFGNVKEEFGKKANEIQATATSMVESIEQTAENKANEAVESAKLSASDTFAQWTETVTQKVSGVAGDVSQGATENIHEAVQVADEESQQPTSESIVQDTDFAENKLDISEFFSGAEPVFKHAEQSIVTQVQDLEPSGEDEEEHTAQLLTDVHSDVLQSAFQQVENVQQFTGDAVYGTTDSVASVEAASEKHAEDTRGYVQDVTATADEELNNQVNESACFVNNAAAIKPDITEVRDLEQDIRDALEGLSFKSDVTQFGGAGDTAVTGVLSDESSHSHHEHVESDSLFSDVQTAVKESAKSNEEDIQKQVVEGIESFLQGSAAEVTEKESTESAESNQETVDVSGSDNDFLEKAKSLLEAHRNSVDGSRVTVPVVSVTDLGGQDDIENVEPEDNSESASHEATAREFVESIIEKASSLVSESVEQTASASESSSPSDPCVERGEETLAPKKRGVMFASPQISDRSSSSLSSPPELSPPPPHESDLSPPGESSSSSISQSDLVETDDLLIPPSLPAEFSVSESNNNNNNIVNNNAEDEDESIHRVAMEVTAKAVQDAIKIVSENGTGSVLNSDHIFSNDIGITSPSSPEIDDEEMTTTDSSQVERGSPVSDITDTSAHGSVSESLSSYDPGAAFRQDVANLADLAVSSGDISASAQPGTQWAPDASQSQANNKIEDLINFEEGSITHAETPTPTNATTFDSYSQSTQQVSSHDQQKSDTNPSPAFPSEVPFSLPSFDEELSSSPYKPTIVINSPDSAHHTNGSTEDVSSPQTEALI